MNLGIVGSGMIVNDLFSFINELKEIELSAIYGRNLEKIETLASKHQIKKCYLNYLEMLQDQQIDTIYVALPNHLHYEYTKLALENHKHVICEKPFTSNLSEIEELITLANNNNLILLEAITNQYLPVYQDIKLKLKDLGQIKIINANYSQFSSRYNAFKAGNILPAFDYQKSGGALMDLNVYNIHYLVGLFGQPKDVHYYPNIEQKIDTSGILILDYEHFKAVCIGAKDCKAPIISTIQGDLGNIIVEGPTSILNHVNYHSNDGKQVTLNLNNEHHRMYYEFKEFARIINEKDYDFASKMLEHSRIVMEVLTKARKSANLRFGVEIND